VVAFLGGCGAGRVPLLLHQLGYITVGHIVRVDMVPCDALVLELQRLRSDPATAERFANVRIITIVGKVEDISAEDIICHVFVNIVCSGPHTGAMSSPCQGTSGANAYGLGFHDEKSRPFVDGPRLMELALRVPMRGTVVHAEWMARRAAAAGLGAPPAGPALRLNSHIGITVV
jgi:hypothetical protein